MPDDMESRYDHAKIEPEIYARWEQSGYFAPEAHQPWADNPDNLPVSKSSKLKAQSFSIIMPPPNANGHLHAGHAMFVTIEDIMIRYARMRGMRALWLPGADHAGFEAQVVYEKKLEKEGRSRFEMSREDLYGEMMAFTLENKKYMESELRALGASCDWTREKFTLDPDIVAKVHQTFKKLFDDGLAYRGKRIVSWCTKHQTSFSDLEIEDVEREDPFYYLQYGPFTIGTARPETKFGDKYVVMHPDDPRYAAYENGQKIDLEWINGPVSATVVKDEGIDREFGTGAMTITPWHDAADFDIAERHKLDKEQVIDERGRLLPIAGEFAGMKIEEARPKIVEKLKQKGLLVRVEENYKHVVRTCYKCGTVIEPQIREQWFVKTQPLAARAIEAIERGEISFIPEHYKKICLHWLRNIIDWNVSRQIAWGIRIPAWFCLGCGTPAVGPKIKSKWFLVRHGETDLNKEKRAQGGGVDMPLNDTGLAQARKAAETLKSHDIDLIISSSLIRARQTAEIIAEATGAEIIFDQELRERNMGKAERMLHTEVREKYPGFWRDYHGKSADNESYAELEERVHRAFKTHQKNHGHKNVVVVSHGGTMRTLLKRFKNWDADTMLALDVIPNAEPMQIDIGDPCRKCGGDLYEQDPDVFDTWFSSGQWPSLALGYPDGKDFKEYYPTTVMETAGEIIFFWVTRMIMFGLYMTGHVPFRTVYLHGLVLDAKGRKMSKSKNNVINPLEITAKYGTDAFRMALVVGNTPGTSLALSEDRVRGYRNFSTKIWNAARFVLMHRPDAGAQGVPTADDLKNLEELGAVKAEVASHIEHFEFHLAAEKAYHYFWHTFADKIIESAKSRLKGGDKDDQAAAYAMLERILLESLKMLHPFAPFVTEAVWQKFLPDEAKAEAGKPGKMLMVESW